MGKLTKYALPVMAGAALLLSSCADDPVKDIMVKKPASLANKVDYSGLSAVKDALPSIKVSCDVAASDFTGVTQIVAVSNFAEIQSPADFSMNSCVSADGNMSFSKVKSYIQSAKDLGLSVYGSDLVSNATINKDYLAKVQKGPITRYQVDSSYTLEPSLDNYIISHRNEEVIVNGDCEGADNVSFFKKEKKGETVKAEITACGKAGNGILVSAGDMVEVAWDTQFWINFGDKHTVKGGDKITVEFDYKASKAAKAETQFHTKPGVYKHWNGIGDVDFTDDWKHFKKEITVDAAAAGSYSIAFNLNVEPTATDYYFDNISVLYPFEDKSINYDQVNNGDAEGPAKEVNCIAKIAPDKTTDVKAPIEDKVGKDGSKAYAIKALKKVAQSWDTQFWIVSRNPLKKGDKIKLHYDYKATQACSANTGEHAAPGKWLAGGYGTIDFTTDWQTFDQEVTVQTDGAQSWAFDLSQEDADVTYYFDNIKLVCENVEVKAGTFTKKVWREQETPLTKEQKDSAVNAALEAWIAGMMEATNGVVSSWDAVTDPLAEAAEGNFDFKNYLGDEYVPTVLSLAKDKYKGDNKSDLKLFVAVSDAQDAANLKDVADAIKTWDAYGINAKFNLTASDFASFESALATLEATGKPYRITINSVSADDVEEAATFFGAMGKALASASKLDGINFSKMKTDDESFGLWNSEFARTAVYEAFVNGLQGK